MEIFLSAFNIESLTHSVRWETIKVSGVLLLLRGNVNKLPRQNVNSEYSLVILFFKWFTFSVDEFFPGMVRGWSINIPYWYDGVFSLIAQVFR